jgi:hypothetical protein
MGFKKTYSKKIVEALKKKGALSGCVQELNYDVFINKLLFSFPLLNNNFIFL